MDKHKKSKLLREYLSLPEHKLIFSRNDSGQDSASTYYDIEISSEELNIEFSISIGFDSVEEACSVIMENSINCNYEEIKNKMSKEIMAADLKQKDKFFATFKGNRQK